MRSTDVIMRHTGPDQIGREHFRYQQKINNMLVEGAVYVLHMVAGKIKNQNGEWITSQSAGLPTTSAISEGELVYYSGKEEVNAGTGGILKLFQQSSLHLSFNKKS